jgi:hypothetical protein
VCALFISLIHLLSYPICPNVLSAYPHQYLPVKVFSGPLSLQECGLEADPATPVIASFFGPSGAVHEFVGKCVQQQVSDFLVLPEKIEKIHHTTATGSNKLKEPL